MSKKIGRPNFNPDYKLTKRQKSLLVAMILTDGNLSHPPKNKNPLVGFQNCDRNKSLVQHLYKELKPIIKQTELTPRRRGAPGSGDRLFLQWFFRTVAHPELLQFEKEFGGAGKNKTVPKVSYLVNTLDWHGLAVMLMCDGSKRGGQGRGMELHLQGFNGSKPLDRVCVALYHRFGIKAFPSYYGKSQSGVDQYHIQISGYSLPIILKKVRPLMLPSFLYKIPNPGTRRTVDCYNSRWWPWYRQHKNAPWLETLEE